MTMFQDSIWQPQIAIIRYVESTHVKVDSKILKTRVEDPELTAFKHFLVDTTKITRAVRKQVHELYPFFF